MTSMSLGDARYTLMGCTLIPQELVDELVELGFTETAARERVRQELLDNA